MSLRHRHYDPSEALQKDVESQVDDHRKEHVRNHHSYSRWNILCNRGSQRRRRLVLACAIILASWGIVSLFSNGWNSGRPHNSTQRAFLLPANQKVSVVVMNHNRPRMIRESQLFKTFTAHPAINEILLCHSNPTTKFDFLHAKVKNIDAVAANTEIGLSLRFRYCETAVNDWVIMVDDDMELSAKAVDQLLNEFAADTHRIVGHYGRNYNFLKAPFRNGYDTHTVAGPAEVILTKIMIMERDMCGAFFRHADLVKDDLLPQSHPLWNGEDIFMSLVANHEYSVPDNGPYRNYAIADLDVWEASDEYKDDNSGAADVSGNVDRHSIWKDGFGPWWQAVKKSHAHAAYRGKLWYTAKQRLAALRETV